MTEPLRFPCRDREMPFDLNEVADMTKETLDGDERRVIRQLALELVMQHGHFETYGDAVDALASAGPQGRRELVDRARTSLGMATIEDERFEAHKRARERGFNDSTFWSPDAEGRRLTQCADPDCTRIPTTAAGAWLPVAARKWWCDQHRDQAGAEDHLPPPERYVVLPTGGVRAVGEEAERLRREDEKRRAEFEAKERARREEGERLERLEAEHRAALKPPAWMGPG